MLRKNSFFKLPTTRRPFFFATRLAFGSARFGKWNVAWMEQKVARRSRSDWPFWILPTKDTQAMIINWSMWAPRMIHWPWTVRSRAAECWVGAFGIYMPERDLESQGATWKQWRLTWWDLTLPATCSAASRWKPLWKTESFWELHNYGRSPSFYTKETVAHASIMRSAWMAIARTKQWRFELSERSSRWELWDAAIRFKYWRRAYRNLSFDVQDRFVRRYITTPIRKL